MEGDAGVLVLYQALQDASSQSPEVMKPAEVKLSAWESEHGFYTTLAVSSGFSI